MFSKILVVKSVEKKIKMNIFEKEMQASDKGKNKSITINKTKMLLDFSI